MRYSSMTKVNSTNYLAGIHADKADAKDSKQFWSQIWKET